MKSGLTKAASRFTLSVALTGAAALLIAAMVLTPSGTVTATTQGQHQHSQTTGPHTTQKLAAQMPGRLRPGRSGDDEYGTPDPLDQGTNNRAPDHTTGPAMQIAGKVFAGTDSDGDFYTFRFLPGGLLDYTSPSGTFRNGTWKQQGARITFEMNGRFSVYTGHISGNRIKGKAINIRKRTWTWNVELQPGQRAVLNTYTPAKGFYSMLTFRECIHCPLMVVLPRGSFTMGSPQNEEGRNANEGPQHKVRIPRQFAMAQAPVTVANYLACVRERQCSEPEWRRPGSQYNIRTGRNKHYREMGSAVTTPTHPITGVTFNQIKAYVRWINSKVPGSPYRLPSEAEWAYAARANTGNLKYWWGNQASHRYANYGNDQCCAGLVSGADKWFYTSPIGSFPPNPFRMKDMYGNTFEWVADCYHKSYNGAPDDGSAWVDGACRSGVLRGSSWGSTRHFLRTAKRTQWQKNNPSGHVGFRLARDL